MSKKKPGATAISIQADRIYLDAMIALAAKKTAQEEKLVTVGDLVRQACDNEYGEEMKPLLDFFYDLSGARILQSEQ